MSLKNRLSELKKKRGDLGLALYDDHPLVDRRDFLAAGLIRFSAIAAAPTIFSLLRSGNAFGCETAGGGQSLSLPAIVHLNLAGGPGLFQLQVPRDAGNQLLSSYSLMGLGTGAGVASSLVPLFGRASASFGRGYIQGINRTDIADPTARAAVTTFHSASAAITACCQLRDDSSMNRLQILGLLSKAGMAGTHLPPITTRNFGQQPALVEPPPALDASSVLDIERALRPQGALASFSAGELGSLYQFVKGISARQALALERRSVTGADKLRENMVCAGDANTEVANRPVPKVNPKVDAELAAIAQVWGVNANTDNGNQSVVFSSMVYSALMGYTGPVQLQIGGRDYHNNTRTTGDANDLADGVVIAKILQTAMITRKKLVLIVTADGSVQSPTSDSNEAVWTSDRGQAGTAQILVIDGESGQRPRLDDRTGGELSHQIGYFGQGQNASMDFIAGWNDQKMMAAVFANILAWSGHANLIDMLAPGQFSSTDLNKILKLGAA